MTAPAEPRVRIAVLGPLAVTRDGAAVNAGSPQQQALLAALVLREGAQAGIDELVDGLWGTEPPPAARGAEAGADLVTALTLTGSGEAVGIVRAARAAGLPVAVSFTVEQDGRLPDDTPLSQAIGEVDAEAAPDYFMVNCAHPSHVAPALTAAGNWRSRIVGLRANASARSHEELDAATDLDEGDPLELARAQDALRPQLPSLALIGGCCGTDARHVAAMWADPAPPS